jgi:branched-chain amino acid transport system ATP-binding protein
LNNSVLLDVSKVTAGYGNIMVLQALSLQVFEGEAVGLVGPNGHGKSTLLGAVSGINRIQSGSIHFSGIDITNSKSSKIVKMGLSHVAQGSRLFSDCTVEENLMLGAYLNRNRKVRSASFDQVFTFFPKLHERKNQLAKTLSGGERQMLAIGVGLMSQPRLLILDEPTLGLSPSIKSELLLSIKKILQSGASLVIVDGDFTFVRELTERWYGVSLGQVAAEGNSKEEMDERTLKKLFFGESIHE